MRHILIVLCCAAFLLVLTPAPARAQEDAMPGQSFGFDYNQETLELFNVDRFQRNVDDTGWVDIGIPPIANDAQTLPGADTYATPIPALTAELHDVLFRACNGTVCGDSSVVLSFRLRAFEVPGNARIIETPAL